jgi:hypothetical protein
MREEWGPAKGPCRPATRRKAGGRAALPAAGAAAAAPLTRERERERSGALGEKERETRGLRRDKERKKRAHVTDRPDGFDQTLGRHCGPMGGTPLLPKGRISYSNSTLFISDMDIYSPSVMIETMNQYKPYHDPWSLL